MREYPSNQLCTVIETQLQGWELPPSTMYLINNQIELYYNTVCILIVIIIMRYPNA